MRSNIEKFEGLSQKACNKKNNCKRFLAFDPVIFLILEACVKTGYRNLDIISLCFILCMYIAFLGYIVFGDLETGSSSAFLTLFLKK